MTAVPDNGDKLIRIVKMTFEPSQVEDFQKMFEQVKDRIRGFEGCSFLELYQDRDEPSIFFTYSYWEDEQALNRYRHSDLFKEVWSQTKKGFREKPLAWSVAKRVSCP